MGSLASTLVVLAFGLSGVALAQPGTVVDPWPSSANVAASRFGGPSPAWSPPRLSEIRDPWALPKGESNTRDFSLALPPVQPLIRDVPPVASGLEVRDERVGKIPPPSAASLVPLVASGLDLEPPNARATATRRVATWSARYREIVQPWQRMPELAASAGANLIVDPWAPSVRRAPANQR